MADGTAIGIKVNGDLDGYQRPRLVLKDGCYRWWSTVMEQGLREKKVWGHVMATLAVPGPTLVLGAGATPAVPAVATIPAAMGVAPVLAIHAVPANVGVTQAQVDAFRVAFEQYLVNEAKANSMILLTMEQKDVMTLLAFPGATGKWNKLAADHVSITQSRAINANQKL